MVVKVTNTQSIDAIQKKYKEAGKQIPNLIPAHKKVAIYLDQWVQKNFKSEGGNLDDGKWKAFKYGGRAIPDMFFNEDNPPAGGYEFVQILGAPFDGQYWIDKSAKLLQDTGRLKFSFLPFANKDNAGIGSNLLYSKAHNDGFKKIPQRRMLPNENEVHGRIHTILESHAKKAMGITK